LQNLRIGAKLAVAVLLPLVGLVGLAGYNLADKWRTRAQMAELGSLAEGAKAASRLTHELQRERGLSAIFVSAKGAQMAAELPAQRKATDGQRSTALDVLSRLRASTTSSSFRDAIDGFRTALAGLDERRKAVDALTIAVPESSAFFTGVIARLLSVTAEIAKISSRGEVTTAISAYLAFSQGKERAGQERAAAGSGIAVGRFDPALYQRVLGLAASQQTYFDLFEASASARQREFYQQTMSGPAIDTVTRMRQIIAGGGLSGELSGIDGKSWFDAATVRIDRLKLVEDRVAADLTELTDAIHADATRALLMLAVVLALLLALCVGLVMVIARSITRPLAKLVAAMKELAAGNFNVALPGLGRRDEVGEVAGAVELFKVKAVEKAEREAQEKQAQARAAAEQRRAEMHQLADSFEAAVGSIIDTVSSTSVELEAAASTLTDTAARTERLSTSVAAASQQASSNVQTVASASEELATSVMEVGQHVHESSRIAAEAVRQASRTNAGISELSQAGQRIGDVVRLITAIAEQTNLLALNATIEAARAGEAGRGFAVVAQEVKALAGQTAKATDEIGNQIAAMQAATQESVGAIKEIGATIDRVAQIATSVAAAVEEQGAATREIARNVQEAARGTSSVAENIENVNRGAADTGSASSQVLASARLLSNEGSRLKLEVDRFLDSVRAA
jgi:methyl-accepting chemotaxis protein